MPAPMGHEFFARCPESGERKKKNKICVMAAMFRGRGKKGKTSGGRLRGEGSSGNIPVWEDGRKRKNGK